MGIKIHSLLIIFSTFLFSNDTPNIILVMVDDFGHECVENYGGESYSTPQLTRMANEGAQFINAHSQNICTPSRVQIMTGKYNVRNYTRFANIDHNECTFGKVLKEAGYATCIAGKWQLGGNTKTIEDHGFDEHCLWQINGARDERYVSPTLLTNGKSQRFKGKYGPRIQQDFVKSFIRKNKSKPFFIYYPMTLPHYPFQPSPKSKEWDPNRNPRFNDTAFFPDMVAYLDLLVGELMDLLIAEGIDKNTLLIFTSDNGTDHRIVSLQNGTSVPGAKGKMNQYATHVPFLIRWPNVVESGTSINALIDFSDIYPTLLDVADINISPKDGLDGTSILPLLTGEKEKIRDLSFCWYMERTDSTDIKSFVQNADYKLHQDGRFIDKVDDKFERNPIPESELSNNELITKSDFKNKMNYFMNLRPKRIPYNNNEPIKLPGKVEFEMYDIGLPNVTYFDNSKGNSANGFWRRDNVDILSRKGRHVITETEQGEWLEYSINVHRAKEFTVSINYSAKINGAIHFELNGERVTPKVILPKTPNEHFESLKLNNSIHFRKGTSILKVFIEEGGINLDSCMFY